MDVSSNWKNDIIQNVGTLHNLQAAWGRNSQEIDWCLIQLGTGIGDGLILAIKIGL